MGFYPEEVIQEIQDKTDIVEIVSEYTSLRKRGNNYVGLCPFHSEKTPSFNVDAEKRLFYCFGCGVGGNVFSFIMKKENMSFPEAVRYLADKLNIKLSKGVGQELSSSFKERREYYKINHMAAKFFKYCLLNTKDGLNALEYLKRRGITPDSIEKFNLGYAPASWDGLIKFAVKRGIKVESLKKNGLIIPRKDHRGFYDRFRNRIMFPIVDTTKNIIGFGGRALDDSKPKYLNSPETPYFTKGETLYGLCFIKKDPSLDIILVEGYMDCIALHQHGFTQAVASLGTALTKNQARMLKKYTEGVLISYDADEAGKSAALRGIDILIQEGLRVKILNLPADKDPDEVIKSGGIQYFKKLIAESEDYISYKLKLAKKNINTKTTDGKLKFIKRAVNILASVDNEPELEIYLKKLSHELGITYETLKREIKKRKMENNGFKYKNSHIRYNNKEISHIPSVSGLYKAERECLKLLIENENLRNAFKDQIESKYFNYRNTKQIADIFFKMLKNKEHFNVSDMFNHLDDQGCRELSAILMEQIDLSDEKYMSALVRKIKEGFLRRSIAQVREQINKAGIIGKREEINDLLSNYQQLKAKINELNERTTSGREGA